MKKVVVIHSTELEVKPFKVEDFIQNKETRATMKKVTKKELKNMADSLGMHYDDADITFSKKLLNAYLAKR